MLDPASLSALYRATPYWVFFIVAAALFLAGFMIRHRMLSRRFRRTNEAGVQVFRSYSHMYLTRAAEQLGTVFAQLLMFTAAISVLAAILRGIGR